MAFYDPAIDLPFRAIQRRARMSKSSMLGLMAVGAILAAGAVQAQPQLVSLKQGMQTQASLFKYLGAHPEVMKRREKLLSDGVSSLVMAYAETTGLIFQLSVVRAAHGRAAHDCRLDLHA